MADRLIAPLGKHRKPKAPVVSPNIEYIEASYSSNDISSLATLLREREVNTVISTITILGEQTRDAQLSLIRAAILANEKLGPTKRFVPSEFGYVNVER